MKTINRYLIPYLLGVVLCLSGFNSFAETPYTLRQCKELALKNSLPLKNSALAVAAAAESKKAALTAYFPKLALMGNYFKNSKDLFNMSIPFMPGVTISMLDRATVLALTVTQPIFAGGRIITANKLASLGKQVEEKKEALSKNDILLKTEEQYWTIVALDEKLKTMELYISMVDDLLKQVSDAYKYGIVTRNEVLKVSVKRSELDLNKQRLLNGRHLAGMAFCQLLGIPDDPSMHLTDSLAGIKDPQLYFIDHPTALTKRAEYALLLSSARAEKLQTAMKRGEYLPQIGIGASAFHLNAMDNGGVNHFAIFCSVTIPVSDWWEASHTLKEKKLKENIAANTLKDSSELLLVQMQKAWYQLTEAYKEVSLATELLKQAEENLKVNQDSYRQGVLNTSDLLDAQALQQQAKVQNIEAMANYRVKLLVYLQVTAQPDSRAD